MELDSQIELVERVNELKSGYKSKINMLVKLREWVITEYKALNSDSPLGTITTSEVATSYETIVNSIDDILQDDVEFK